MNHRTARPDARAKGAVRGGAVRGAAARGPRRPDRPDRPDRPRRTRRWVLAGACALLAVPVLADRVAAGVAEDRMADRIAARQSALVAAPDVSIDGFPFLWNAAAGSYPEVEVEGRARTDEGLPVTASLDLREVSRTAGGYAAATARGRFEVPLDALAAKRGAGFRLTGRDGRLEITRSFMGVPLVVTAELKLSGDTVTLEPAAASLAGRSIDPANPQIAAALRAAERKIPELPLGLVPSGISVDGSAVTVHAEAREVALADTA
ncbi:LmeA family phospholipid-binding protein [Streptomyces vinaceus]|uniref:LmeA family phospholipid-binding protein n=1 Tax=Streptomyces vinaceus TaxID=1960 RepID=UPI003676D58D